MSPAGAVPNVPAVGAAAERGGQVLGLGLVAADDLDRVAALDRTGGYGAGHAS